MKKTEILKIGNFNCFDLKKSCSKEKSVQKQSLSEKCILFAFFHVVGKICIGDLYGRLGDLVCIWEFPGKFWRVV